MRVIDFSSDSSYSKNHRIKLNTIMKVYEIINELTFHGSKCKDKCQGHRAGWYWARKQKTTAATPCNGSSQSFNNGCNINTTQRSQGKNLIGPSIRGDKGKFTKYTGTK